MSTPKAHSRYLVLGMILVAANLRLPITMMPGLLPSLQHELGLPSSLAGLLTTIPLLAFAIASPLLARWGQRFGTELVIYGSLILIGLGSFLRLIPTVAWLFVGTSLLGVGVAGGNVLIPAIIKDDFSTTMDRATTQYTLSMLLVGALGTGVSGLLAARWSLTLAMAVLSLIALVNLVVWLPNLRFNRPASPTTATTATHKATAHPSVWRTPLAWVVTGYFGVQSLVFYVLITWLPEIFMHQGFSAVTAGTLVTVMQLSNLPMAYIVPMTSSKPSGVAAMLGVTGIGLVGGVAGFLIPHLSLGVAIFLNVLIGLAAGAAFNLSVVFFTQKTTNGDETAALSGMAQSAGYLVAAVGPVMLGWVGNALGWSLVVGLTAALSALMTAIGFVIWRHHTIYDHH
ncbi:CynX/NimT family MFS transporter [Levilactobacillus namurensis]|uniref:CynX/NimT family MFS transporter n=1 Tax=Levilactobacillus namurensis TaxID=380393 RepID=UPI0026E9F56D|nr:MFS transporter [Levilactobacillus namurensis]